MSYRKDKKILSNLLKDAKRMVDEHPISHSANHLVKVLIAELAELKRNRK